VDRAVERVEHRFVLVRQPLRPAPWRRDVQAQYLREPALVEPDDEGLAHADDRYGLDVTRLEERGRLLVFADVVVLELNTVRRKQ
jgi:hypothetical protein